jgi:mono/diheme cytochrome c family protein
VHRWVQGVCAAAVLLTAVDTRAEAPVADPLVKRGEYIYRVAGCENCHTDREAGGALLAGGRALKTPLGTFHAPNISPDQQTGIGRWSETDFFRALRDGVSPSGQHYYPSFPYAAYTRLSDDDVRALWAYLGTRPAVRQPNREHDLPWFLRFRSLLAGWKRLYFSPGAFTPRGEKSAEWNRGAYLVQAAAHCGECHTPRNALGGFRDGFYLAGTRDGADGGVVPNITPDKKTGIGRWRASELVEYLESGMTPDGDFAGDLMTEVIDHGLKHLTRADRRAIAVYVLDQPPVEHAVRKAKKKKKDDSEY